VKRLLTAVLIAPIRLYQRWISPALGPRCRYYPSCSDYAVQAIRELGPIRGLILAAWRLLRCNPFSHGGFDELSDRRLFRHTPNKSERRRSPAPPAPAGSNRLDPT
jgi:putative membrane protein insertion efficiency factor